MLYFDGTSTPLTLYGSNPEHGAGAAFYGFSSASDIRILGLKTEDGSAPSLFDSVDSNNILIAGVKCPTPSPTACFSPILIRPSSQRTLPSEGLAPLTVATAPKLPACLRVEGTYGALDR